jgi:hypothetical protein
LEDFTNAPGDATLRATLDHQTVQFGTWDLLHSEPYPLNKTYRWIEISKLPDKRSVCWWRNVHWYGSRLTKCRLFEGYNEMEKTQHLLRGSLLKYRKCTCFLL